MTREPETPLSNDRESKIKHLQQGSTLRCCHRKAKLETRIFYIILETGEIVWTGPVPDHSSLDWSSIEGRIDFRLIKEVRCTKSSLFNECYQLDDANNNQHFTILYGDKFVLTELGCIASNKIERDRWVECIDFLVQQMSELSYDGRVHRWLAKQFRSLAACSSLNSENPQTSAINSTLRPTVDTSDLLRISEKDLKIFLSRLNYKITTRKLREYMSDIDADFKHNPNPLVDLRIFCKLYQRLSSANNCAIYGILPIIDSDSQSRSSNSNPSLSAEILSFADFLHFLNKENGLVKEPGSKEIVDYFENQFDDEDLDYEQRMISGSELINFLYSPNNSIWDKSLDKAHDMTRPLTHYWIASSHNTYLTGDQIRSKSSSEAYARALRMGCRCIEIDCWDGPEGMPIVYHGHTATTKIKFCDVLKTIREHAFETSAYPVILSIENHCSLDQQRKMANAFTKILGDLLVKEPYNTDECMPSPKDLERKIIIKHKKLPDADVKVTDQQPTSPTSNNFSNNASKGLQFENTTSDDSNGFIMRGFLDKQSDDNHGLDLKSWESKFFVLTQDKLFYIDNEDDTCMDIDEATNDNSNMRSLHADYRKLRHQTSSVSSSSASSGGGSSCDYSSRLIDLGPEKPLPPHDTVRWYPGALLVNNRTQAEELLNQQFELGDGTFLVRRSNTFTMSFMISFTHKSKIHHIKVNTLTSDNGNERFYLSKQVTFDTIASLVEYYQRNPLKSNDVVQVLVEPIEEQNWHRSAHLNQDWYHPDTDRRGAEECLRQFSSGSFLVRKSEAEKDHYSVSFVSGQLIKHLRVKSEKNAYLIGMFDKFTTLVDLVQHFRKHYIYMQTKLKNPISVRMLDEVKSDPKSGKGNSSKSSPSRIIGSAVKFMSTTPKFSLLKLCYSLLCSNKQDPCGYFGPIKSQTLVKSVEPCQYLSLEDSSFTSFRSSEKSFFDRRDGVNWWNRIKYDSDSGSSNDCKMSSRSSSSAEFDEPLSGYGHESSLGTTSATTTATAYRTSNSLDEIRYCSTETVSANNDVFGSHNIDGAKWNFIEISESTCIDVMYESNHDYDDDDGSADCRYAFIVSTCSRQNNNKYLLRLAAHSSEKRDEWVSVLRRLAQTASVNSSRSNQLERTMRIAKELSNLIVYCRAVPFDKDKIGNFTEMSSFAEHKVEKWISPSECSFILNYHQRQFTRVYPKGLRAKSSNFDAVKFWNCGVQMAALNYQTPDRAMQINQAMFRQNHGCGYVLRPNFMFGTNDRDPNIKFDPYNPATLDDTNPPICLKLTVISGRHLGRNTDRGYVSPYVEIEIAGIEADQFKEKTSIVKDNGLNPIWNETFNFTIRCQELAFLRITVLDQDVSGDARFLGHGTYPINCICRRGYRSIPLMNEYSEPLELSTLLVRVHVE